MRSGDSSIVRGGPGGPAGRVVSGAAGATGLSLALAAAGLVALVPVPARADGPAPGVAPATEEAKLTARLRAEEGDRLYDVADFAAAAEKYKAAYLLVPEPELLFSLGECFWNLRDPDRAAFFYRRYLAKKPDAVDRPMVEARLVELDRLAAAGLRPPPAPATAATGPHAVAPAPVATATVPSAPAVPLPAKRPLITRPEESAIGFSSEAPPPPNPGAGKVLDKWWFWAIAGVVLAGAVTAVVIVVTN